MQTHDPYCRAYRFACTCADLAAARAEARADEQARHGDNCGGMWDEWTHDLHAQVEALRDEAMDHYRDTGEPTFATSIVAYQTVLGLLKGGDDGDA